MKVAENVKKAITPLFDTLDLRLVDVEYVKRFDGMHLIVLIDKDSGVTVEDCSKVSTLIDPILEELNPTNDASYFFDVSSYGLDRPLKFDWQFDKYKGQLLDVKLYMKVDGFKDFTATINDYNQDNITFLINGEAKSFARTQIATILPHLDF